MGRLLALLLYSTILLNYGICKKKPPPVRPEAKTVLMFKQTRLLRQRPIHPKIETFKNLAMSSSVLIDRSLLIKEILEYPKKRIIITCPRKWSKSVNLHMIKTFFQMETDFSGNQLLPVNKTITYQLFVHGESFNDTLNECFEQPFLISKHQNIIDKHLGQYPVLYMRFKFIQGLNDAEAIDCFKTTLLRAYKPYRYMMNILKKVYQSINETETARRKKAYDYYFRFKRILEEVETNENNILTSLEFLCKMLYRHHRKRVIILIDDYDSPFYKILHNEHFIESDIKYVLKYMNKVIGPILADDNPYVERVIMTATHRITDIMGPVVESMTDFTLLNNPWLEYFGVTDYDLPQLCKYMFKTDEQCQNAFDWYMGYKSATDPWLDLGSPFSMALFLATNSSENYVFKDLYYDYMFELMRLRTTRDLLDSLTNERNLTIDLNLRFTKAEILHLKHIVASTEPQQPLEQSTVDLVFSYLCASGYLTFAKPNATTTKTSVWLPNKETLTEVGRKMKAYYNRFYGMSYTFVDKLASHLGIYAMNQEKTPTTRMEICLNHLFNSIRLYNTTHSHLYTTEYYEDVMHAVLNFISMKLRALVRLKTLAWRDGNPPVSYMEGVKKARGIIIAMQYNQTANTLLALAKEQKPRLEKYEDLEVHKFIGIGLDANRVVSMAGDCDYLKDKELIYNIPPPP